MRELDKGCKSDRQMYNLKGKKANPLDEWHVNYTYISIFSPRGQEVQDWKDPFEQCKF